jgi:2-dehydropantoate 2-reductase
VIVLVVGAGAVGSFLGGTLAAAGQEVLLLRRPGAVGEERRRDLRILQHDGRTLEVAVSVVDAGAGLRPDLILFAVKAFALREAAAASPLWPAASALTVQNGVGAEEEVAAAREGGAIVAGSLTASLAPTPEGSVRRLTRGGIGLAPFRGTAERLIDDVVAAFTAGGLPARRYPDARAMKWSKLLGNLMGNATSALLDVDPADVYADPRLFAVERAQLREALAVMRALGLRPVGLPGAAVPWLAASLGLPAPLARLILLPVVRGARGGKAPSLRASVQNGGGTSEIAWLNGAVARAGERCGVPAPVNRRLLELVSDAACDERRRAWFRGRPDRLLETISTHGSSN